MRSAKLAGPAPGQARPLQRDVDGSIPLPRTGVDRGDEADPGWLTRRIRTILGIGWSGTVSAHDW